MIYKYMKLKEFLKNINLIVKNNPEVLDYEVIYSIDDEGNEYNKVIFEPEIGIYENREFSSISDYKIEPNAIVIN